MESARAILQLQKSTSEAELLDTLQRLTVQQLKFLCKETAMKCSGIKAEIVGRLVTNWKAQCNVQPKYDGEEQGIPASGSIVQGTSQSLKTCASRDLPVFEAIPSWT